MRVCMLPTDTWGVGSYRCLFPGRELEKRGHEVFVHIDRRTVGHARTADLPMAHSIDFQRDGTVPPAFDADVYVFQRRMERRIPAAVRQLRSLGKVVVGEADDNYDALPESSPGWLMLRKHPDKVSVDWLNEGLAECDAVTVSTPALADHYSRLNANVHVLPNFLDWTMWRDAPVQYEVERPRIRVGWMGWLQWRGTDLEQLRPWLGDWLHRHPEVEFVSVGEGHGNAKKARKAGYVSAHSYLGVPKGQRFSVKAAPFKELAKITATIDVGLVPLTPGLFNECKSYLKGLEYAACGIPCVATPTEQYRGFVREGEDGFLASTPAEWMRALDELVADDGLRRRMGAAARAKAEQMTIQREWRRWERLYESLCVSTSAAVSTGSRDGSTSTTPRTLTSARTLSAISPG